ncbi:hypothetical protein SAMN02745223_02379 [Devosia limi DSM 17137]|uniref:Uncharacterized protein n=1 Tax=Devosia limi DSM 17137 TaxID=1121477 RepID=A0A1M5ASH7_9HYPH|nr:hypothetical protein SAMN02745223_02379 [Devosia limi DSM 17137]
MGFDISAHAEWLLALRGGEGLREPRYPGLSDPHPGSPLQGEEPVGVGETAVAHV